MPRRSPVLEMVPVIPLENETPRQALVRTMMEEQCNPEEWIATRSINAPVSLISIDHDGTAEVINSAA